MKHSTKAILLVCFVSVCGFAAVLKSHSGASVALGNLEREAFYKRARNAFAIVLTADLRAYGNILLVKGVVNEYRGR